MRFSILLILLSGISCQVISQSEPTGSQAYEYLQNERKRAEEPLAGPGQPPPDSLKKAERILRVALDYYHRPAIQELARNNESLFYRKGDILFDLALVQTKMGHTDAAAQSLVWPLSGKYASAYVSFVDQTDELAAVEKHPLLAPLFAKVRAETRLFNSDALKTKYQPNLSEAEKVAGLSTFWAEAKYNFAFFDQVPDLDWDQLYLEYLPKVRATNSTVGYLRVLQEFCAHLQDGHTGVWANDPTLADLVARRPPLRTRLVGDKVLVQEVQSDSLLATGIRPGLEIVRIDEMPVRTYADRYVRPYQSGSTPQNVEIATYHYDLLKGPKEQPVSVEFREPTGKTFVRVLPRTGYGRLKSPPAFEFRMLPGNIAYVQLNDFSDDEAAKRFAAAYDSIAPSRALILDVRDNGGGNSGVGWNILGYLTDSSMQTGRYSSRLYSPLRRAQGEGVVFETADAGSGWRANGKRHYQNPVVVLTSAKTFSAAEDFVVVFDAMQRGTLIGETTGGSTGQPLAFSLPGGVMARVCTKRDAYPDGTEWVGKGIEPDRLVRPTVADFQAGRDTVLEAALAFLGAGKTKTESKKTRK